MRVVLPTSLLSRTADLLLFVACCGWTALVAAACCLDSGARESDPVEIRKLLDCFEKASSLNPENFDYHLRFAQSFFDCPSASRMKALRVWDDLIVKFPKRSSSEKDYFKLCKGRILLELNRDREAVALIESVSTRSLTNTKLSLLKQIKVLKKNQLKEISGDKDTLDRKTGAFLQILPDPHLDRLHEVTSRLKEERLLGQLRTDVLRAHLDGYGKIQVEFSNRSGQSN